MKQKNWFRSILLFSAALILFFSCSTANNPKDDGKVTENITLTYATESADGTLEVKYGEPLAPAPASGQQIPKGSKVVFTATPKQGFKVKAWTGVNASPADTTMVTVAKADSDLNVKVSFEKCKKQ
ncbi:MAG: InlB B-repeat-containing protein [Treponema sp.]